MAATTDTFEDTTGEETIGADRLVPKVARWSGMAWALIVAIGTIAEVIGVVFPNFDWHPLLVGLTIRNHAADFGSVGMATCVALLHVQQKTPPRIASHWSWPWIFSTGAMGFDLCFEYYEYRCHPSTGDWRDLLAEALGWLITMSVLQLAARADRRRVRRV